MVKGAYSNLSCQHSLWKKTGVPRGGGGTPRIGSAVRIKPTISDVKNSCSDDCPTNKPIHAMGIILFYRLFDANFEYLKTVRKPKGGQTKD